MIKFYKLGKKIFPSGNIYKNKNDKNNIFFDGWAIHKKNNHFWVTFVAAAQGGEILSFDINESIFLKAKQEQIDFQEIYKIHINQGVRDLDLKSPEASQKTKLTH